MVSLAGGLFTPSMVFVLSCRREEINLKKIGLSHTFYTQNTGGEGAGGSKNES